MSKLRRRTGHFLQDLLTLAIGLIVVAPILYGLFGAFKTPAEFALQPPTVLPVSFGNLDNFRTVVNSIPLLRYFLNSLTVAMLVSIVRLIVALMAAYAFVYYCFPGHNVLFFVVLATMMLPGDTMTVTNYQTISRLGLLNTYLGMSIVSFVGASQMFMLRQSFKTMPTAIREAAILDGCGDLRYLFTILAPLTRPVLVTLFVQSFVASWNTYLWPLMVTSRNDMRTIQVGITMLTSVEGTNYETILAGVMLSLIPALFVFLFLRRFISKAMTAGSLVG